MAERKRIREPPSVPHLWELRPGIANKDWKPHQSSASHCPPPPPPPPVKLVASVPFNWEEKPGTPLPSFSTIQSEALPQSLVELPLPPLILYQLSENCNNNGDGDSGDNDNESEQQEMIFNLDDLEDLISELSSDDDESFSSAESSSPSLLILNCIVLSTSLTEKDCFQHDISADLKTDYETTSGYVTGASSPDGATFLERLFPLLPPKSSFLENVGKTPTTKKVGKDLSHESNTSVRVKKMSALGELIMMSRRMSYHRKVVQMRKQNLSMEFMKSKAFVCFGTFNPMVGVLQRKKFQPILKLIYND